ncbi:MAG: TetR family transcriptional regulator [Micrococcales bacterium]|nr:TetR family transcriptional regulator [Micrococcales bacterium]
MTDSPSGGDPTIDGAAPAEQAGSPRRSRGRRPGAPDTRGEILRAARKSFAESGFEATSIRGVARDAGVDPALVHHYFGGKVRLLLAVARVGYDPRQLLRTIVRGGRADIGWRTIRRAIALWESPIGETFLTAIRQRPDLIPAIATVFGREVVEAATHEVGLPPDRARERVAMFQTLMGGLVMTRYIARMEPAATLRPDEVERIFGPILQGIVDGQFDRPRRS